MTRLLSVGCQRECPQRISMPGARGVVDVKSLDDFREFKFLTVEFKHLVTRIQ